MRSYRELVAEVGAARVCCIKVALYRHADTAADDAVAVAPVIREA